MLIKAVTLEEAWIRTMYETFYHGREYFIDRGSRAGQNRLVLDVVMQEITHPESRPLAPISRPATPSPCSEEDIEKYFHKYILSPHPPEPEEHYNYSEWLNPLAHDVIRYYIIHGYGTAHCTMRVGDPMCFRDYFHKYENELARPTTPCLLGIDTRVINEKLVFYVMYRSWDLLSGYPMNMGGIQLLKEYMADMIGLGYGPTYVFCKDLHLYEADLPAVRMWIGA